MNRKQLVIDLFGFIGFFCIIWGIGRLSFSAALIIGGTVLALVALLISRDKSGK